MKKLIFGGLAALAIGLAATPVAGADPDAHPMLSANDRAFIRSTDQVIMMHTSSDPDGHWVGYSRVPAQLEDQYRSHGVLHAGHRYLRPGHQRHDRHLIRRPS